MCWRDFIGGRGKSCPMLSDVVFNYERVFHPMHDCVPSVVTIAVRMVMTISTMRFNVNLFIFDV